MRPLRKSSANLTDEQGEVTAPRDRANWPAAFDTVRQLSSSKSARSPPRGLTLSSIGHVNSFGSGRKALDCLNCPRFGPINKEI